MKAQKNSIQFHTEDIEFTLHKESSYKEWLIRLASTHNRSIGELNYIFTSDEYLLEINKSYLDHDFYTDIISFPLSDDPMSGDIFISIERVRENAEELKIDFSIELLRVISHGLLHFIGFDDHDTDDIAKMRQAEEQAIELFL